MTPAPISSVPIFACLLFFFYFFLEDLLLAADDALEEAVLLLELGDPLVLLRQDQNYLAVLGGCGRDGWRRRPRRLPQQRAGEPWKGDIVVGASPRASLGALRLALDARLGSGEARLPLRLGCPPGRLLFVWARELAGAAGAAGAAADAASAPAAPVLFAMILFPRGAPFLSHAEQLAQRRWRLRGPGRGALEVAKHLGTGGMPLRHGTVHGRPSSRAPARVHIRSALHKPPARRCVARKRGHVQRLQGTGAVAICIRLKLERSARQHEPLHQIVAAQRGSKVHRTQALAVARLERAGRGTDDLVNDINLPGADCRVQLQTLHMHNAARALNHRTHAVRVAQESRQEQRRVAVCINHVSLAAAA
jgi:hypothetical protein